MELAGGIRGTAVMEHWFGLPHQSALMFAARITLPHFSISSAMSLPQSLGEPARGSLPMAANRALMLGSARIVLISLLSLSTTAAGVPLGAPTPSHPLTA